MLNRVRPRFPVINPHHPMARYCRYFGVFESRDLAIDYGPYKVTPGEQWGDNLGLRGGWSGSSIQSLNRGGYWSGGENTTFASLHGTYHPLTLYDAKGVFFYIRAGFQPRSQWGNNYPRIAELSNNNGTWADNGWTLEHDIDDGTWGCLALVTSDSNRNRRWAFPSDRDNTMQDYILNVDIRGAQSQATLAPQGVYYQGEWYPFTSVQGGLNPHTGEATNTGFRILNRPDRQRPMQGDIEMLGVFARVGDLFYEGELLTFLADPLELISFMPDEATFADLGPPPAPAYEAHRLFLVP